MIEFPGTAETKQLLELWKDAFGEYSGFWEMFLDTAFEPDHCRCITEAGQVLAGLFWFDCSCGEEKIAYIYAVATRPDQRGRGLCKGLLQDVHSHLAARGYSLAMLVPEGEGLRRMYGKLGYREGTNISEFSCTAGPSPLSLRAVGPKEYAALRREFLPDGGVIQEGKNLAFLSRQTQFYAGTDFLLAAYQEGETLTAMELLGNREAAPGILRALNLEQGTFRIPGEEKPFAMAYPLQENAVLPSYFGFAFD